MVVDFPVPMLNPRIFAAAVVALLAVASVDVETTNTAFVGVDKGDRMPVDIAAVDKHFAHCADWSDIVLVRHQTSSFYYQWAYRSLSVKKLLVAATVAQGHEPNGNECQVR